MKPAASISPVCSVASSGHSLMRQGAVVFSGSIVLGCCGFLFQMIASRRLGVDAYGTLYTILSVVVIAGIPGALLAPVIARCAAEFRALHDDAHVRGLMTDVVRWVTIAMLVYLAMAFALAVPVARYLHVATWTIPAAGTIAAVGLGSAALRAIAQGTQDFTAFAISAMVEGIAKVTALALLAMVGLTLLGGLLGFMVGLTAGLLVVSWSIVHRYAHADRWRVRYDWHRIGLTTVGASAITVAMALLGTADVVLVKHYFSAHEAGLYSAAALAGKTLLFLVGFVPTVLLPHATDRHERGERAHDALFVSVGILTLVALTGAIALRFFAPFFLHVLVGPAFDAALPLVLPYALAMVSLGLTSVLAFYSIATHRIAFVAPLLAGTAVTLASIAAFHPNLADVVLTLAVGNVLTCAAVAAALSMHASRPAHDPAVVIVGTLPCSEPTPDGPCYDTACYARRLADLGFRVEVWTKPWLADACTLGREEVEPFRTRAVWTRGPFAWVQIALQTLRRRPQVVHFQHGAFVLGAGLTGEISSLLLCTTLRLLRVPLVVTCNDVPRLSHITRSYVKLHRFRAPADVVSLGLRVLFSTFGAVARWIIVHEPVLVDILASDYGVPEEKIFTVPARAPMPRRLLAADVTTLRAKYGIPQSAAVLFSFGFATGYKGLEVLLDAMDHIARTNSDLLLLLGAGPHPKHAGEIEYDAYYRALVARVKAMHNVRFFGFLPDSTIDELIACADLGVFPYVTCQGTSGPVNSCISQGLPVVISTPLQAVVKHLSAGVCEPTGKELAQLCERYFSDAALAKRVRAECDGFRAFSAWAPSHDLLLQRMYQAFVWNGTTHQGARLEAEPGKFPAIDREIP